MIHARTECHLLIDGYCSMYCVAFSGSGGLDGNIGGGVIPEVYPHTCTEGLLG